ncbi:VOC family protein [Candidatus Roizmanbacteria bacterium]|nr:VOC family protein [Candidatus Roizmanbacteria bacterium]
MKTSIESVMLFSKDAKKLAYFYRDTVDLKLTFEAVMGTNIDLYQFEMKNSSFYIIDNPKIKGKSEDSERFLVNFEVRDIETETKRLRNKKVKMVGDIQHIEGYGFVSSFVDIDGNNFHLVQTKGGKIPKAFKK